MSEWTGIGYSGMNWTWREEITLTMAELEPRPHLCSASICWVARERERRTGELTVCSGGLKPLLWSNRVLGTVEVVA